MIKRHMLISSAIVLNLTALISFLQFNYPKLNQFFANYYRKITQTKKRLPSLIVCNSSKSTLVSSDDAVWENFQIQIKPNTEELYYLYILYYLSHLASYRMWHSQIQFLSGCSLTRRIKLQLPFRLPAFKKRKCCNFGINVLNLKLLYTKVIFTV